jgi:succinate dehydrogenase/fumarate reductase cytochrome b subunit
MTEPIALDFISNTTQVEVALYQSTQTAEDWSQSVYPGFIASMVIIGFILFFFFVIPNGIWIYLHYQGKYKDHSLTPSQNWAYKSAPQYKKTQEQSINESR